MSELDDIRSFLAVVETGGFSRAAQRLGLAKSVVSRRVTRLEEELGAQLLSRNTRGISATEAGTDFKLRAERILAELEEAREAIARKAGGVAGRLRVAMPLTFGSRHVAPLLGELAQLYPRLEIEVEATDRFVDLIGERFDAAIRIGALKDSSLIARQVAPIHAALVASPGYLERRGAPQTPADLAGHECLIYTGTSDPDWTFRNRQRLVAIRPSGRLRSDNGDTLCEWAAAGLGIALLPTFIASADIRQGRLVPIMQDYQLPARSLHVVRPAGAHLPGKVRALIDLMVERFGGTPYWDPCQIALHEQERRAGAEDRATAPIHQTA